MLIGAKIKLSGATPLVCVARIVNIRKVDKRGDRVGLFREELDRGDLAVLREVGEDVLLGAVGGEERAEQVEVWGGRRNRLHDRLVWTRVAPGGLDEPAAWRRGRLQP